VTGDPGFDPEPVTAHELAQWKEAVLADAERTFAALEGMRARFSPGVHSQVETLLAARGVLCERVRALRYEAAGLAKTRYHGDLHLGQVLLAQNDFIIIDFERAGTSYRRAAAQSTSPLRVSPVRSISYAAHAAPVRRNIRRGRQRRRRGAAQWEHAAAAALEATAMCVQCYFQCRRTALRALIELFTFKSVYELLYEMDNRPEWISIPLRGLIDSIPT
jgi:maltose alpha-D-glucosyltransferase/alpha-amylase